MIILKRQHGWWVVYDGAEPAHVLGMDDHPAADMLASARRLWPDALIGVEPADGPVVWITDYRLDYGPLLVDTR
jgi:hypothetical protein